MRAVLSLVCATIEKDARQRCSVGGESRKAFRRWVDGIFLIRLKLKDNRGESLNRSLRDWPISSPRISNFTFRFLLFFSRLEAVSMRYKGLSD